MITIVVHTEIQAFAAHVWAALADFGGISHWSKAVRRSEFYPAEGDAIGSERHCKLVGGIPLTETITGWHEGRSITYIVEGLPLLATVVVNWHLEPIASITRVTVAVNAQPAKLAVLARPLLRGVLKRQYQKLVWDFKQYVEKSLRRTSPE